MSIGQRLKDARKSRKMSQIALAEKIGTSRGVITNIEHDKVTEPQAVVVKAICEALNISSEWLTTGNGSMDSSTQNTERTDIVAEINTCVQGLSANEQLYILDTIKTYIARLKD